VIIARVEEPFWSRLTTGEREALKSHCR